MLSTKDISPGKMLGDKLIAKWHVTDTAPRYCGGNVIYYVKITFSDGSISTAMVFE